MNMNDEQQKKAFALAQQCMAVLCNYMAVQYQDGIVRLAALETFLSGDIEARTAICLSIGTARELHALLGEILKLQPETLPLLKGVH